ncbi:hypothetical protein [Streptomyces benahoarensis]|uniref:Uncharacterized protein n=1 Tax=Streptomyces benahoarensis TaxID=2595054 RepID=A0A553ZQJ3_9ACTN|nr:hypothetical protein [Streptomyces benahoarensis]TSB31831.1 hypothetical protein FNJ62_04440 [Streptomyces benahoarensis]TSB43749.1 hypothetical protein FNZ23_02680 [Streptomyces benahoarensis]
MTRSRSYELSMTTQGPLYPPSEVMNTDGHFVVIGGINRALPGGEVKAEWGSALVAADSVLPPFGENAPYRIIRELTPELSAKDREMVLCTLPLPLPCSNYTAVMAPEQQPDPFAVVRPSYPFHQVPIPDLQPEDGPKVTEPVTLGQWIKASGNLTVTLAEQDTAADFRGEFHGLIPNSLYTVMAIRRRDLDPDGPSHPSPFGVPNVFVADEEGNGSYHARLPHPFPAPDSAAAGNRIVNFVVLWMSYQMNYGGAVGHHGLGSDIHAQLRLPGPGFGEFVTHA